MLFSERKIGAVNTPAHMLTIGKTSANNEREAHSRKAMSVIYVFNLF
ncbi:hypothetical protein [Estrella lausannensis]|nr:hypothetical protein [Estrella lausannensis]